MTDNTKFAERFEDMSRLGRLHVLQQDDGDMIVAIIEDPNNPSYGFPTVEFCTSGGKSPHTREALRALMRAIERDNLESSPSRRGESGLGVPEKQRRTR